MTLPATGDSVTQAFVPALLDRLPTWFFVAAALLLLVVIAAVAYVLVRQALRFTAALGAGARIDALRTELEQVRGRLRAEQMLRGQMDSGLVQLAAVLEEMATVRPAIVSGASPVAVLAPTLRRLLESLCNAIKRDPRSTHRCAAWLAQPERRELVMLAGSSGFPPRYEGQRSLDFDASIAGRAYVRNRVECVHPVQQDEDFASPLDDHSFDALICVPLRWEEVGLGVLAVDGTGAFVEQDRLIAVVYAKIAQMMLVEWSAAASHMAGG